MTVQILNKYIVTLITCFKHIWQKTFFKHRAFTIHMEHLWYSVPALSKLRDTGFYWLESSFFAGAHTDRPTNTHRLSFKAAHPELKVFDYNLGTVETYSLSEHSERTSDSRTGALQWAGPPMLLSVAVCTHITSTSPFQSISASKVQEIPQCLFSHLDLWYPFFIFISYQVNNDKIIKLKLLWRAR